MRSICAIRASRKVLVVYASSGDIASGLYFSLGRLISRNLRLSYLPPSQSEQYHTIISGSKCNIPALEGNVKYTQSGSRRIHSHRLTAKGYSDKQRRASSQQFVLVWFEHDRAAVLVEALSILDD